MTWLDAVEVVCHIFRTADPEISDLAVASWLAWDNDSLLINGGIPDPIFASPLEWLAWGGDAERVFTLARRTAGPLAW